MELGKHNSGNFVATKDGVVIGGAYGCVRDVKKDGATFLRQSACSQQSDCGQLHGPRVAPEWEQQESSK